MAVVERSEIQIVDAVGNQNEELLSIEIVIHVFCVIQDQVTHTY